MNHRITLAFLGAALVPVASLHAAADTRATPTFDAARIPKIQKSDSKLQIGLDAMAQRASADAKVSADALQRLNPYARFAQGPKGTTVIVDAVAQRDAHALAARLEALGAQHTVVSGRMVSARVPVAALAALGKDSELMFARPAMARTSRGAIVSQGDFAIRGPQTRPPQTAGGPTGSGVTVAVMSDSFNCLGGANADVAADEFEPVNVVKELTDCGPGTDEGRAMIQIVADVAPNASLQFREAFEGMADFATGIRQLSAGGADIIVDDIGYFLEPFFHDGIVAQAVDDVVADGTAYFSAASNSGRMSWEDNFNPTPVTSIEQGGVGIAHNFNSGGGAPNVLQRIGIAHNQSINLSFQWDQAFASSDPASPGSASDMDIFLVDGTGTVVAFAATDSLHHDADELLQFQNTGPAANFFIYIEKYKGKNPGRLKYIDYGNGDSLDVTPATNSGCIIGHANAAGAFAVGAAAYFNTPECGVSPAQINNFSSAGGVPIRLKPDGTAQAQVIRNKPDATGPDGGNTTFFGQDISNPGGPVACRDNDTKGNFFGTSAASPHVAAVAALMKEKKPNATPAQIYAALRSSTSDMGTAGFDFDSGTGFVRADDAVTAIASGATPTVTFGKAAQSVAEGATGTVAIKLSAASAQVVKVTLQITGTATNGTDYNTLSTTVNIPAGVTSKQVKVVTKTDAVNDPGETAILTIKSATNATVGTKKKYTLTIN